MISRLITKIIVLMIFIIPLVIGVDAIPAEYKGAEFPSNEIILKQRWFPESFKPSRIVGKYKVSENEYILFYFSEHRAMKVMTIMKLDTNIWIHLHAQGLIDGTFLE